MEPRGHGKTFMRVFNDIIEFLRSKGLSDKEIQEILNNMEEEEDDNRMAC